MNKLWMVGAITLVVIVFWILMRYPPEDQIQGDAPTESKTEIILPTALPGSSENVPPSDVLPEEPSYAVEHTIDHVIGSTTIVGNRAVFLVDSEDLEVQSGEEQSPITDDKVKVVADWQYYDDKALQEMEVPEDTVIIGIFAFARSGIERVILPEGLTTIEYAAFYHCDNLIEVDIPTTVTKIEAEAFAYTPWLNDFLSGKSGNSDFLIVGDGILLAYRGNASQVVIPEGVKTIAANCFFNHTEIKDVVYPGTLKSVEESAFYGCKYQPTFR